MKSLSGATATTKGPCVYRTCKKIAAVGRNQARDAHTSRNRAPD
jgi:hypothetical protein